MNPHSKKLCIESKDLVYSIVDKILIEDTDKTSTEKLENSYKLINIQK